jgi:hypothetical protein
MNDLLDSAVAAHGGLDRWNHVRSITVDASITHPHPAAGYAWQGDYQLVPEPLLVAIDMGEITIR